MHNRIIELLYRNLQEVFGEGDAARRRAAIENFYIEDCVLYVPPGVCWTRRSRQVRGRPPRDTSTLRLYTSWRATSPAQWRDFGMGLRPERRGSGLHRTGCRHCSRWQNRCALRLSRSQTCVGGARQPCGLPSQQTRSAVSLSAEVNAVIATNSYDRFWSR